MKKCEAILRIKSDETCFLEGVCLSGQREEELKQAEGWTDDNLGRVTNEECIDALASSTYTTVFDGQECNAEPIILPATTI